MSGMNPMIILGVLLIGALFLYFLLSPKKNGSDGDHPLDPMPMPNDPLDPSNDIDRKNQAEVPHPHPPHLHPHAPPPPQAQDDSYATL